jgi:predicted DNA-binding transcriptional regulator AlpA
LKLYPLEQRRIIRKAELLKKVPFSYPTIWRWEKVGRFPSRVRLTDPGQSYGGGYGPPCGWWEHEIDAWLASRVRVAGPPPAPEPKASKRVRLYDEPAAAE